MNNFLDLETKAIQRFFIKEKRKRYLGFIQNEKHRHLLTDELAHFKDLKYELFEKVAGNEHLFVLDRIKPLGKLKTCYLISESGELDQKQMDIDTALTEVIGCGMGTLIIFGDADMVYYEGEGMKNRWISKHGQSHF